MGKKKISLACRVWSRLYFYYTHLRRVIGMQAGERGKEKKRRGESPNTWFMLQGCCWFYRMSELLTFLQWHPERSTVGEIIIVLDVIFIYTHFPMRRKMYHVIIRLDIERNVARATSQTQWLHKKQHYWVDQSQLESTKKEKNQHHSSTLLHNFLRKVVPVA